MSKTLINFFDRNTGNDPYANMHWPVPEIEYVKPGQMKWEGISVFTDEYALSPVVDDVESDIKIAWAFESPVIKPHIYQNIPYYEHKFDYIYTCYPELYKDVAKDFSKYKQCYFGACWVPESHCKIYDKTKMISIVASNKTFAPGHRLRHDLIGRNMVPDLELWGSGYNWFSDEPEGRIKPFADYRYCIVIENIQYPNYFTDKIIDCFATGTIPIYWGDPNMGEKFNTDGFYTWQSFEELEQIIKRISEEDYNSKRAAIEDNFNRFREYASPDKWMLDNAYKPLLNQ